jgi:hypothetical protein
VAGETTSGSGEGPVSQSRLDEGESIPDEPVQAPKGGADAVEASVVDGVSDSPPQPDEEVATAEDSPTIKQEGPLSTVQEEIVLEEKADVPAGTPAPTQSDSSDPAQTPPPQRQVGAEDASGVTAPRGADRSLPLIKTEDIGVHSDQLNESQARTYVADQVRRWEQVRSEMVTPLKVRYAWTSPGPDFQPWWTATLATSEYLRERVSPSSMNDSWVDELELTQVELCLARDIVVIGVPPSLLSSRECVALLQTLLFQSGFRFRNLIPMWFKRSHSVWLRAKCAQSWKTFSICSLWNSWSGVKWCVEYRLRSS